MKEYIEPEPTEQEIIIGKLRKATAVPDVADLFQEARYLSLTEDCIKEALKDVGLDATKDNREEMRLKVCEELEKTGKPSVYGMAAAREQHKALQRIRRAETSYMIGLGDNEVVSHEAEEEPGSLYKHRGTWKMRRQASDASHVVMNDLRDLGETAMQESAFSDVGEQDRIWYAEYVSRKKVKGVRWTAKDRKRASRIRKSIKQGLESAQTSGPWQTVGPTHDVNHATGF